MRTDSPLAAIGVVVAMIAIPLVAFWLGRQSVDTVTERRELPFTQRLAARADALVPGRVARLGRTTVELGGTGTWTSEPLEVPEDGLLALHAGVDDLLPDPRVVSARLVLRAGDERRSVEVALPDPGSWTEVLVPLDDLAWRTVVVEHQVTGPATPIELDVLPRQLVLWGRPRVRPRSVPGPNLVLISLDTVRADHLGVAGYPRSTSPNTDALALRGAMFETAIAPASWTLPSHMSIMTGLGPERHGANRSYEDPSRLRSPPAVPMLAQQLRRAGYATAGFVDNGGVYATMFYPGFDAFTEELRPDSQCGEFDLELSKQDVRRWLEAHDDQPFFLFAHTYQAHTPYCSSTFVAEAPSDAASQDIARYDGDILRADELVGAIVDALARSGQLERTLVVVLSDHGEELDEGREFGTHEPRHKHGHTLYDELVRVPLIVAGPGVPAGLRVPDQVQLVDVMPTILDLIGLEPVPGLDGVSVRPLLARQPMAARPALATAMLMGPQRVMVRTVDRKLILRTGRGPIQFPKSTEHLWDPAIELFDLSADPGERTNLAGQHPDLVEPLRALVPDVSPPTAGSPGATSGSASADIEALRALGYVD